MRSYVPLIFVLALALPLAARATQTPAHRAATTVAFFDHHRKAAATPAGQHALWHAIHVLAAQVRSLQAVRQAQSAYPPHHALWECIHRYEASSWAAVSGNGHYGGLQMTYGWLGYVQGNPALLTQAEQEWAAERAWAASGYSYNFLYGQWYEWDAADGCGTTG